MLKSREGVREMCRWVRVRIKESIVCRAGPEGMPEVRVREVMGEESSNVNSLAKDVKNRIELLDKMNQEALQ